MMKVRTLFQFGILFSVLSYGCDYNASQSVERHSCENEALIDSVSELRARMEQVFVAKVKHLRGVLDPIEKSVVEVQKDIDALTAASTLSMMEKDVKGGVLPIENRLLHLTRDAKVNALAVRYLKTDFNRDAALFIEEVKIARAAERRYFDAMKKVDASYARSLMDSEKWLTATSEQREKEISRLRAEIMSLETSRKSVLKDRENLTKNKMQGSKRMERERRDRLNVLTYKASDLDGEIQKKRLQMDFLTAPEANSRMESRAVNERLSVQGRANIQRDQGLRDIERNMKPKRMLINVISDYNSKTVGVLQKTMIDELSRLRKQVDELKSKLAQIEDARLLIPVSDKDELIRLRKMLRE